MVVLLALIGELLRKMEISKWAMVLGSTGNPACAAGCQVIAFAMRGNVCGVGLTVACERRAERGLDTAKNQRMECVFTWAQAEAYATERRQKSVRDDFQ